MYEQIETFNSKPHYWENKSLWSVQNNQSVTDGISKFNFRNKELSVATYDFSALCTNIPENNWKTMWEELISLLLQQNLVQNGLVIKISSGQYLIKLPCNY